jgi:hypothetical protein
LYRLYRIGTGNIYARIQRSSFLVAVTVNGLPYFNGTVPLFITFSGFNGTYLSFGS